MGRHAKPHNPKEQPPDRKEGAVADEHRVSRGRHSKDRRPCAKSTPGEQATPSSSAA
ncbi:hypothetical protein SAMN05421874_14513 [Nonomuraea maritima]|uniref:Uncharacterized protein n=1 Tax=Nonomuraea maritima TaxID=683260 RepID=A0A1G9REE0_9ACTN|nr:hypothetical protein [Nonomuraea maritima]SDM21541.1 hypothetical protein SAMN05421874_14513 [Nonomuraea maritima]